MRFFPFCKATFLFVLIGMLGACCGNVEVNSLPCYKELFTDSKETVQKQQYELDKRRAPRFNR